MEYFFVILIEACLKILGNLGELNIWTVEQRNTQSNGRNMLLIGCDTAFMVPYIDRCNESGV